MNVYYTGSRRYDRTGDRSAFGPGPVGARPTAADRKRRGDGPVGADAMADYYLAHPLRRPRD